MRLACVFVLIAACDFKPPPKQRAVEPLTAAAVVPPTPAPAVVPPAVVPPVAAPAPTMGNDPKKPCTDAAIQVAQILIDDTAELSQKAALEQDRSKIVKSVVDTCMRDAWAQSVLDCIAVAKTQVAMRDCTKDLKSP